MGDDEIVYYSQRDADGSDVPMAKDVHLAIKWGVITAINSDGFTYKVHLDGTTRNSTLPRVEQLVQGGDFGDRDGETLNQKDGIKSRGARFTYKVNERVVVAFAYGRHEKPFIIGSLPNFRKIVGEFDAEYMIKDEFGNIIQIDKGGTGITITQKGGTKIEMTDTKVNINGANFEVLK